MAAVVLAVVVSFLNEERYLPTLLRSIDGQTMAPDRMLLVDDGSSDGSAALAEQFAATSSYAVALHRPPRPPEADRLASAAELRSFSWAIEQLDVAYDVVVKLDADLELAPDHFAVVVDALERDPRLGIAGAYLSVLGAGGRPVRERHPADHVRGPNKFYRRSCLEQIGPLPDHLGWDTIDEVRARMHGWRTASIALPGDDSLHLRPTGSHGGSLRAFRRWGECVYGAGTHPLAVLLGGVLRLRRRPYVIGGLNYLLGWASAALRRVPRAEPELRAFKRAEDLRRIRRIALPL